MFTGISILTSRPTDNVHPPPSACNAPARCLSAESFRRLRARRARVTLADTPGRSIPLRFGSSNGARFESAGCSPQSYPPGLRSETVSDALLQKFRYLTYFGVPVKTASLLSLTIRPTYK